MACKKDFAAQKKAISKERVQNALDSIVTLFESDEVPDAIKQVVFPPTNIPACNWSLCNRVLMVSQHTLDARGYKQWQAVGRNVKKGSKAIYILAPSVIKVKEKEEDKSCENEAKFKLVGFTPIALFSAEKTEGEPLEYEQHAIPTHPLLEKAKEWGIDVCSTNFNGEFYGYWMEKCVDGKEKIKLCTPNERTFFHEMAHAAHRRTFESREAMNAYGQQKKEIVAELSAQVVAKLLGREQQSVIGNGYNYIKGYCNDGQSVGKACLEVIADVEKVLILLLGI